MARVEHEVIIVPSVLDRLLDNEPEAAQEPTADRYQSVRELKRSVARDLEALLNTRREALDEIPSEFTEVNRSLVNYGLQDFTAFNLLSLSDRNRVRRALEQVIAAFEPRLERVRVNLEPPREHDRTLRFRIEALLNMKPATEPVTFDTVLQLYTQAYVVKGQD